MSSAPKPRRPARRGDHVARSTARLAAVQALYQAEVTEQPARRLVREFVEHRLGEAIEGEEVVEADRELFTELVEGTLARQEEIDGLLTGALAAGWPLDRLESILRALLRVATYELLARPDVPARVVITEYLDIAHAFFTDQEPRFANGVLDTLAHKLRPAELPAGSGRPT
jgi:N utilization substance protein B